MPYNTRRKSLSLPSLGIQLPNTVRPHRSNSSSKPETPEHEASPPAKRVKRDHTSTPPLPSPRRTPSIDVEPTQPRPIPQPRNGAHTPPPSPGDVVTHRKIDLEGINDDVVISCIEQLEKTANRPHLLKELATVLLTTNRNIAKYVPQKCLDRASLTMTSSANPAALLSSRLTQYMKRPWTALSPCPIAKELVPVHPRKVFFFLTSRPRGELPANSDDIITPAIADIKRLTPSISDPSIEDEDAERLERMRFSPSPEIEFFSSEIEVKAAITPGSSYSSSIHDEPMEPARRHRASNRAPSPTLEADERGFTETASAVRASRLLQKTEDLQISIQEPSEEPKFKIDHDVGMDLFGRSHTGLAPLDTGKIMMSSPMISAKHSLNVHIGDIDMEMGDANWNIKSPEATSFDELDQMFDDL